MKDTSEMDMNVIDGWIKKAGIRSNVIRRTVLYRLTTGIRPLTHGELIEDEVIGAFDRVTLYRTLTRLQSVGLIHVIEGIDGIRRYSAHNPEQPHCPGNHPHFICEDCGIMICLIDQSMPRVTVGPGSVVKGKQLLVYGLCPECAKKHNI